MSARLNEIVEPDVFSAFVKEKSPEKSALISSGAVICSSGLNELASRGGRTVKMPFWNRLDGDSETLNENESLTPTPVLAAADVAPIIYRGRAWSARELSSAMIGDSAISAVADMVADYWAREEQKILVASLSGIFAGAGMNGHVYGDGLSELNAEMTFDAMQLLGDSSRSLCTIIMHSAVYTSLLKQNIIDFIQPSEAGKFNTYLGLNVIVDDNVSFDKANGTFDTYLLRNGVIGRGDGAPVDFTQCEVYREGLKGEDTLIYRKALILHPYGVAFTGANFDSAGSSPSQIELADGANWERVYDEKNVGLIMIKHTI